MIYIFTAILLVILFFIDKKKTLKSLKIGLKKLIKQLPLFISMSCLIALSLCFLSDDLIAKYLGKNSSIFGVINAAIIGSIAVIPGFIAFPLAGLLIEKGVTYMIIASFTNTLMMVGIVTIPLEKEYFGTKVAIIRNIVSLIIALIAALLIGLFYGELKL